MKKVLFMCLLLLLSGVAVYAQNYKVGAGSGIGGGHSVNYMLKAQDAGIDYVEIGMNRFFKDVPPEEYETRVDEYAKIIKAAHAKVWSCHLPFTRKLDISVLDDETRRKNVALIAKFIELSGRFSPSKLILHPSSEPIKDEDREQRIKNAIESVGILREYADKIGAQLCVENLPRTCLGNTPEELLRIVADYPEVGVCFDSNHYLKGNPVDYLRKVAHRVGTIHISDYDGVDEKHWMPEPGFVNWGEMVYELVNLGYKGVFMYETGKKRGDVKATAQDLVDNYYEFLVPEYKKYAKEKRKEKK